MEKIDPEQYVEDLLIGIKKIICSVADERDCNLCGTQVWEIKAKNGEIMLLEEDGHEHRELCRCLKNL